jgi:hypothetical protein
MQDDGRASTVDKPQEKKNFLSLSNTALSPLSETKTKREIERGEGLEASLILPTEQNGETHLFLEKCSSGQVERK